MSQNKHHTRKRRPGRDPEEQKHEPVEAPVQEHAETPSQEPSQEAKASSSTHVHPEHSHINRENSYSAQPEEEFHLEFYGSELIRLKAPKVMEVADQVAKDWMEDGSFEGLPVGHPLAQIAVARGLQSAKKVEKKLEEAGVFALAKMGLELAKSKLKK